MPRKTRNLHLVETALLTPKVYLQDPKTVSVVPVTGAGKGDVTIREDIDGDDRVRLINAQYQADSKLMQQAFCQRLCCAGLIGGGLALAGAGR